MRRRPGRDEESETDDSNGESSAVVGESSGGDVDDADDGEDDEVDEVDEVDDGRGVEEARCTVRSVMACRKKGHVCSSALSDASCALGESLSRLKTLWMIL